MLFFFQQKRAVEVRNKFKKISTILSLQDLPSALRSLHTTLLQGLSSAQTACRALEFVEKENKAS